MVNKCVKLYLKNKYESELRFYNLSSAKCNEIIYFVLSVKWEEEIDFPQTLLKA